MIDPIPEGAPPSIQDARLRAEPLHDAMAPPERSPYESAAEGDTMGLRHVEVALSDLPFPATRAEILARAGAWRVPVTGTHFHPLAQFLEGVPEKRYHSLAALMRAVGRAHRELMR